MDDKDKANPLPGAADAPTVLILPGWLNSDASHWQSRWESLHGHRRVEQDDWLWPRRGDWMARLDEVLLFVHPVMLGGGRALFDRVGSRVECDLVEHEALDDGVTLQRYTIRGAGSSARPA